MPCNKKERVYFAGRFVQEEGVWKGTDRLGTVGQTAARAYPYGEANSEFATYRRDTLAGLDYAWNRYYSSTWGRFTSADPYQTNAKPTDPQSWNAYAYAGNDPTNLFDPTGLQAERPYPPGYCPAEYDLWQCTVGGYFRSGNPDGGVGGGGGFNPCLGQGTLPNPMCVLPIVVPPPPPPPPPPAPAQPTCTVELWYRPVEDSGGHTHAYLKVSLTFEGQTSTDQIEGGPQRRSLLDPGNLVRRDYSSGASNSTRKDNHKWGGTLTSAQDPALCDKLGKVYVGVQYVQDHPVQYSFNGPNSNSYVNYLLQNSGISYWITAPPGAWAWGVKLYQ